MKKDYILEEVLKLAEEYKTLDNYTEKIMNSNNMYEFVIRSSPPEKINFYMIKYYQARK